MTGAMRPNAACVKAYRRGFAAGVVGDLRNPYLLWSASAGVPRASWWDTGYQDAKAGKPERFR